MTRLLEARDRLGGLLAGGLPGYRLPVSALARDLAWVRSLGIETRTGAAADRAALEKLLVITSYSIHYTKLYDWESGSSCSSP